MVEYNLESHPLQFTTDVTDDSKGYVTLKFFGDDDSEAGRLTLAFVDPIKYRLGECDNRQYEPFPHGTTPEDVEKVWTVSRDGDTLTVDCNGVTVLDFNLKYGCRENVNRANWEISVKKLMFTQLGRIPLPNTYRKKPG